MKILLLQVDGKIPNLALMRISAHHKALGDTVELRRGHTRFLFDQPDKVYASAIFDRSRPMVDRLRKDFPDAIVGGSFLPKDEFVTIEQFGITTREKDYSLYPEYKPSLGYTQRGCRMNETTCPFCKVPWMEGKISANDSIQQLWRGEGHPKHLHLLDNDFFGLPAWRENLNAIRDGGFKVCFNQGINARLLSEESCEALASVQYYDDSFKTRRIYTAWDGRKDEEILFTNLKRLVKYGVKPDHLMVYMLVGCLDTEEDREYRRARLRDFGARPYPMPWKRTPETVGFQRWIIGAYDKRISWADWKAAKYEPRNLGNPLDRSRDVR